MPLFILGEVLEVSTHSETTISGSGGHGSVSTDLQGRVTGSTAGISISSSTYTKTKLWVKLQDGSEEEWIIPGEISARSGHKVILISVFDKSKKEGGYKFIFINLSTRKMQPITMPDELGRYYKLTPAFSKGGYVFLAVLGAIFGAILLGNLFGAGGGMLGFFAPIVFASLAGVSASGKNASVNRNTVSEIENYQKQLVEAALAISK